MKHILFLVRCYLKFLAFIFLLKNTFTILHKNFKTIIFEAYFFLHNLLMVGNYDSSIVHAEIFLFVLKDCHSYNTKKLFQQACENNVNLLTSSFNGNKLCDCRVCLSFPKLQILLYESKRTTQIFCMLFQAKILTNSVSSNSEKRHPLLSLLLSTTGQRISFPPTECYQEPFSQIRHEFIT